jgi:hypothetical protein
MDLQKLDAKHAKYGQGQPRGKDFTAFLLSAFVLYVAVTPTGLWLLGAINAEQAGIVAGANVLIWIGCIWFSQWYVTHGRSKEVFSSIRCGSPNPIL